MSLPATLRFRLYVAGHTPNSVEAAANLQAFCRAHVKGRHHVETVDVLRDPDRALRDGIFMTPTLITSGPAPSRRIVGTLSETRPLLLALRREPDALEPA